MYSLTPRMLVMDAYSYGQIDGSKDDNDESGGGNDDDDMKMIMTEGMTQSKQFIVHATLFTSSWVHPKSNSSHQTHIYYRSDHHQVHLQSCHH